MKKIIRFFKYALLSVLTIILFSILYLFISNRIFLSSQDEKFTDYLKNNKLQISEVTQSNPIILFTLNANNAPYQIVN